MSGTAAFAPRANAKTGAQAAHPKTASPPPKQEPAHMSQKAHTAVSASLPSDPSHIPVNAPTQTSEAPSSAANATAGSKQSDATQKPQQNPKSNNSKPEQPQLRTLTQPAVPQSPHRIWNQAYDTARTGGRPLEEGDRTYFEQRYGYQLDHVRVHADGRSSEAAQSVGARAYTLGNHIVFDSGQYAPSTTSGRQLLGHELAHVVQQSRGGAPPAPIPGTSLENSAWQAAQSSTPGLVNVSGSCAPGIAREARSLTQNLNPATLNDQELEQETMQVNIWLNQHGNVSDPNSEHMATALNRLEAEVRKRHATPPAPKRPILPSVKGTGAQDLLGAMQVVDAIQPSDKASGLYTLEFQGEEKTISQKDYDELRRRARNILKDHIGRVSSKNAGTRAGYDSQKATDREHWLVAPIVKFIGNVQDPGPYLDSAISNADSFVAQAEAALKEGHYTAAAEAMSKGEIRALSAERMWQAYFQGIIGAGEMTITVLEITRDAAFISLAVLATIATGGAAAGALGAAETTAATTTVFGVEVAAGTGTVANAIAVGAPIVASLGEAAAKVAMGDQVDWGELVLNTAISIFLARFGGKATEGIAKPIVARLAAGVEKRAAKIIIEKVIQSAIMHAGSTTLTTTLNALYQKLRGRKMTWGQFMDQLVKALTDPKGLAVVAVTTALTAHVEIKLTEPVGGGGEAPPAHQQQAAPQQKEQTPPPAAKQEAAPQQKEQNVPPQQKHQAAPPVQQQEQAAAPPPTQEKTPPAPPSEKQNPPVKHEADAPKAPDAKPAENQAGHPDQHSEAGNPPNGAPGEQTQAPAVKSAAKETVANAKPAKPTPKAKKAKIVEPSASDVEAQAKKELASVKPPKPKPAKKSGAAAKGSKKAVDEAKGSAGDTQSPANQEPQVKPQTPAGEKIDISKQHKYYETTDTAKGLKYKIAEGPLGKPSEVEQHRSGYEQSKVSAGTGDDAGHLIGNIFGGSGGGENLSLQNWKANEFGTFKKLENAFRSKLENGTKIDVKVTDVTRVGEERPYHRIVEWTETAPDGTVTKNKLDFANMHTPESRDAQGVKPTVQGDQTDNVYQLFPDKGGKPTPDGPPPTSPGAVKPVAREIEKVDPSKFKGPAANDNADHPTPPGNEPNSAVLPVPEQIPEQQQMKMAADGTVIHEQGAPGIQTTAMAGGSQPPGKKPNLTLVKPNEPLSQQSAAKGPAGPGKAGTSTAPPAPKPAIEAKIDQAVATIPEETLQQHLQGKPDAQGVNKPTIKHETQRTDVPGLMAELKSVDPKLHENFELAFNSLHNRALWKTILMRMHAEQATLSTKPSSMRKEFANYNSSKAQGTDLDKFVHEHSNISPSSEAAWNLAEQAHGKTPQLVVTDEFNAQAGPPNAPFGKTFYDVQLGSLKPPGPGDHGATSHMLQDLVITEGFRQAGKAGYTAEKFRGELYGVGGKKPGVPITGNDLWNLLYDGLEGTKLMNSPENVTDMARKAYPDLR